eukprot:jgi/Undpi1/11748/HiC_scaffold_37.g14043.m1
MIRHLASLATLLALPALAQENPAQNPAVRRADWSAPDSRVLFASIDRNHDDRLDLFEAAIGLPAVGSVRNRAGFRRLDEDRDGFVHWDEFDRFFRLAVADHRELFEVHPWHPLPEKAADPAADTGPAAQVVAALDRDHNGRLDKDEVLELLNQIGAPRTLIGQLAALDLDRSADLDAKEFAPVLDIEPLGTALKALLGNLAKTELPADENADGSVAESELASALSLVDPDLARWTKRVLAGADTNRDGTLSAAEWKAQSDVPTPSTARPRD